MNDIDSLISELNDYSKYALADMEEIANKVAREGARRIRSGIGSGGTYPDNITHGYQKGWTCKAVNIGTYDFSFVIYNRLKPGLTHLLENGHQMRNGGRASAFPHIKQVEQWCIEEYTRRVEATL